MKEYSSSRTLSSLFLILSLNDFFGRYLKERGISFYPRYGEVSEIRAIALGQVVRKPVKDNPGLNVN